MSSNLKELTTEERVALVALIERTVAADRYATDEETHQVRSIAAALGKRAYRAAADADQRFTDETELWRFIATITRLEARELIYETVLETVLADAPRSEETQVLDRLSALWHIQPRIVEPPE